MDTMPQQSVNATKHFIREMYRRYENLGINGQWIVDQKINFLDIQGFTTHVNLAKRTVTYTRKEQ